MRKSTSVFAVLVLALIISLPTEILACYVCVSSPSGWSFCRAGARTGYDACSEKIENSFTGKVSCRDGLGNVCFNGGSTAEGEGPYWDEPLNLWGDNSPCLWTDTETIRLV